MGGRLFTIEKNDFMHNIDSFNNDIGFDFSAVNNLYSVGFELHNYNYVFNDEYGHTYNMITELLYRPNERNFIRVYDSDLNFTYEVPCFYISFNNNEYVVFDFLISSTDNNIACDGLTNVNWGVYDNVHDSSFNNIFMNKVITNKSNVNVWRMSDSQICGTYTSSVSGRDTFNYLDNRYVYRDELFNNMSYIYSVFGSNLTQYRNIGWVSNVYGKTINSNPFYVNYNVSTPISLLGSSFKISSSGDVYNYNKLINDNEFDLYNFYNECGVLYDFVPQYYVNNYDVFNDKVIINGKSYFNDYFGEFYISNTVSEVNWDVIYPTKLDEFNGDLINQHYSNGYLIPERDYVTLEVVVPGANEYLYAHFINDGLYSGYSWYSDVYAYLDKTNQDRQASIDIYNDYVKYYLSSVGKLSNPQYSKYYVNDLNQYGMSSAYKLRYLGFNIEDIEDVIYDEDYLNASRTRNYFEVGFDGVMGADIFGFTIGGLTTGFLALSLIFALFKRIHV